MDDIIGNYVPYENKLYIVYKINGNSVYIRNERNMKNTKQITLNKYKD